MFICPKERNYLNRTLGKTTGNTEKNLMLHLITVSFIKQSFFERMKSPIHLKSVYEPQFLSEILLAAGAFVTARQPQCRKLSVEYEAIKA